MALQVDVTNNEVTITPPNEIDIATGDVLATQIERACALRPSTIAVDFRNVTFCDSTAVAVLLSALEKLEAQGCRLVIRNPCTLLRKIVTVLGETERLGIPPAQVPPTTGRWRPLSPNVARWSREGHMRHLLSQDLRQRGVVRSCCRACDLSREAAIYSVELTVQQVSNLVLNVSALADRMEARPPGDLDEDRERSERVKVLRNAALAGQEAIQRATADLTRSQEAEVAGDKR